MPSLPIAKREYGRCLAAGLIGALAGLAGCGLYTPDLPPDPPATLEATQGHYGNQVVLVWTPAEDARRYDVWRASTPADEFERKGETAEARYADNEVEGGDLYYYKVRVRTSGGWSELSEEVSGYASKESSVRPLPPIGILATEGEHRDRIVVSWQPVAGAIRYIVHRADSLKGPYEEIARTEATVYEDNTVESSYVYWYRVRSENDQGRASSMSIKASGHAN